MDPKEHRDARWIAIAGPQSGAYITAQQAQECASEKGSYELAPLGGEDGYYWKWVRVDFQHEQQAGAGDDDQGS